MPRLIIAHEELHELIAQMEQSLYNHQQWFNSLIRTLICHLPAGHSSGAITDKYIDIERRERHASAKNKVLKQKNELIE